MTENCRWQQRCTSPVAIVFKKKSTSHMRMRIVDRNSLWESVYKYASEAESQFR
jgi:hypothetical protein